MLKKILFFACLTLLAGLAIAACGAQVETAELTGVEWTLDTLVSGGAETALETGVTTTIRFGEDGTYNGIGGCNNYSGTYTSEGNTISLGVAASTMMACDTGMEQEAMFLAALPLVTTYETSADGLRLSSADRQTVLGFTAGAGN